MDRFKPPATAPILLYDGVCVLCSRAIAFTLRHERRHDIRFVAIQSGEGRALAEAHGVDADHPDSFLFIEKGLAKRKSDGVIALAGHLAGPARLIRIGRLVPRPLRDWLYDRIALNRYRLFAKRKSCAVPDPAFRHRFVVEPPV